VNYNFDDVVAVVREFGSDGYLDYPILDSDLQDPRIIAKANGFAAWLERLKALEQDESNIDYID